MMPLAVQAAMAAIEKICPEAKNLLLVPENSTDIFYLSNLAQLQRIFFQAGLNVRLGSLSNDIKAPTTIDLPGGESVTLEPLIRSKRRLGLKHFDPCTILLNNDLAAGAPGILEDLHEQYLLPPLHAGWGVRRKSNHFKAYEEVAKRFGKLLGMDPWLITPMFNQCGEVNFAEQSGLECLRSNTDALLARIRRKYKEYGINEKPFVVIKADNSHPALGQLTVRDAKDLDDAWFAGARQGGRRAADWRDDHPGRRADQRAHQRGRGRAGGLHDGPLCGGRFLPRARRPRDRREPVGAGSPASCRWPSNRARSCRSRAPNRAPACPTASTCTA